MKKEMKRSQILQKIIYLIILLPFFEVPYLMENYPISSKIYFVLFIVASIYCLIKVFRKKSYSKNINYLIIFLFILLASTYLNSKDISSCINYISKLLVFSLIVDNEINNNNNNNFIKSIILLLTVLIIINLYTILKYPEGLYVTASGFYQNWFLGYKNTHILFMFPAILFSFLYSYKSKGKLTLPSYLILALSFLSTILVNNSTGITGLSLILAFIIFKNLFKNYKIFNITTYMITSIIIFLSIVIFKVQNIFSFLIVDILDKDITFTGRIYIWDKALDFISLKPLLGYGNVNFQYTSTVLSTHNMILGILFNVGIIGLIFLLIFLVKSFKKLWVYRKYEVSSFVSIFFFAYFIMMLMESYNMKYFIYLLVIPYSIKQFIKE